MWDDYSGDPNLSTSVGLPPVYTGQQLPGDVADAQAMDPWTPAPAAQQGAPWWAGIAAYGITKAIDNQFPTTPTGTWGNVYPGSAPGYNGRTYTQRPLGAGGGVASAAGRFTMRGDPMLMLALVAGAFLLLKK